MTIRPSQDDSKAAPYGNNTIRGMAPSATYERHKTFTVFLVKFFGANEYGVTSFLREASIVKPGKSF